MDDKTKFKKEMYEQFNSITALVNQTAAIADLLCGSSDGVDYKSIRCAGEMMLDMLIDIETCNNKAFEDVKTLYKQIEEKED